MPLEIRIEIPEQKSDFAGLIRFFQERLSVLADALDRDVADFDERAQIDEVHIRKADITSAGIDVTYELRFSAFYGCSEVDYSGRHQRILRGRREGDFWIFSPHQPSPARSTLDEF